MRTAAPTMTLAAALTALTLGSAAQAAAPKPPPKTPPKTSDAQACLTRPTPPKGASLWLASNPHLPLAETRDGNISRADDKEGCKRPARWGATGRSYRVLDRWGKVLGTSKVVRRERYDVSGCEEILMSGATESEEAQGDRLLVTSDGAWAPGPSFADRPTAAMHTAFRRFLSGLDERLVADGASTTQPEGERVAFFRIGKKDCQPRDDERGLVGAYAVAGGPYLVVARYDAQKGWKAVYLTTPPPAASDVYRENKIMTIVDMEGDGVPEVVFHTSEDTAFWDVVVGLDSARIWAERAQSAAGATL